MVKKLLNLKNYVLLFSLFIGVNASFYANYSESFNYVELIPALENELDADKDIVNTLFGLDKLFKGAPLREKEDEVYFETIEENLKLFAISGCPIDFSVDNDPGLCSAIVTFTLPTTDISGGSMVLITALGSGDNFPVGDTLVTFEERDATNTATGLTCSFTVTVVDNEAPTASNPAPVNVQCAENVPAVNIGDVIDESDNCVGAITVAHVSDVSDGNFNPEVITRTYSVTDASLNSINVTQTITVEDTTNPTASNPAPVNVQCAENVPAVNIGDITDESDNCVGAITVAHVSDVSVGFNPEVITRTYSVTDASLNSINVTQTITVEDTTNPVMPVLPDLSAACSLTVTPPTTTDNCDGTIIGVTSGSLIFDVVGSETIFWTFTDSAGNFVIAEQKITITDDNGPVPDVSSLPALNLTGCQITSISDLTIPTATDACDSGTILGTLGDGFVFPFIFSGTQTIDWEFIDSNGNVTYQPQDITLTPIPVSGGILDGTFESTLFYDQIDISSCGVAISIELNLSGENGTIVRWESYAVNHGFWEEITDADGDDTKFTVSFPIGALESTYYRVLVQTGTCVEYSNQFYVRALPAGDAPTVERLDPDEFYCLGDEVNLRATSNYSATQESIPDDKGDGDFNQGQFPRDPNGWLVDGEVGGFTAGGSATKPRNWSAKTCNNQANGSIIYCGGEGKYAIAYGDYSDNKYRGPDPSTLETPILDFSNAESASLDFDQAYNFVNGDYAIIEISTDGGVNYSTLRLMHAVGSGDLDWYSAGTAESYAGSNATNYNFETDNTSIDLSAYIGESNVRIRWTFSGTSSESAWAMDNIEVNKLVIVETDVEWTDGIGDPNVPPIAGGSTEVPISFTPDAPGFHQYGGTALINGCRTYSEEGTALIDVYISYSYAGEDVIYTSQECGQNTVQLNAYDNRETATFNAAKGAYPEMPDPCVNCDDPGTGDEGVWSISENSICGGGTFSDVNDPNAIFTGEAGTYILTWTVNGCGSDITVTITNCDQIDFDGVDDYVDFEEDNFHLDSEAFSIEAWVKPESIAGYQTIFSKRDANVVSGNGYELSIDNGVVYFKWDNKNINSSTYKIGTDRWYHIAITHTSSPGTYRLYIDGIPIDLIGGGSPKSNNLKAILGAMDNNPSNNPTNYFNGWIDEVRIWNVGLTTDQLREMMNQKIQNVSGNVQGEVIPVDIDGLLWSNLSAYFQMESVEMACGYLNSTSSSIKGRLKNISSDEDQTAPIPYTSAQNGNWNTMSTWTQPNVWNAPNSLGVNGIPIDWNIVRLSNQITSGTRDITLLGLISDSGKLTMNGVTNMTTGTGTGQGLWVTHYLKLNGIIDLEGESQLIQKRYSTTQVNESILDSGSLGFIERDQQGQGNLFNYDDWSSPVGLIGQPQTALYSVKDVLKDGRNSYGSDINFTASKDGDMSTFPITVSSRWIYSYKNGSGFKRANLNRIFKAGEGNTMKGSFNPDETTKQNFVYIGKPHNGDIQLPISNGKYYLVGNPYPSALDADQFIIDNAINSNIITGVLEFYEDWSTDRTHIESKASAGYAYYTLAGGVGTKLAENVNNSGEYGSKTPTRYVPVGQAFWVVGDGGGMVKFSNNQRFFEKESGTKSTFFKGAKSKKIPIKGEEDTRLKLRLGFETSDVNSRQLLLTIDKRATDKIDKGFDAEVSGFQDNDLYWIIEDKKLIIQALGNLTTESIIPVGISLKEKGIIKIKVDTINNPYEGIEVFLRDNITKETYDILHSEFETELEVGEYNNKYSVVFKPKFELSEIDEELANNLMTHLVDNELRIVRLSDIDILKISLFNTIGQQIKVWSNNLDEKEIVLPLNIDVGMYLVIIETEKGSFSKKVIKK